MPGFAYRHDGQLVWDALKEHLGRVTDRAYPGQLKCFAVRDAMVNEFDDAAAAAAAAATAAAAAAAAADAAALVVRIRAHSALHRIQRVLAASALEHFFSLIVLGSRVRDPRPADEAPVWRYAHR